MKENSFETNLAELEKIVTSLEKGDCTLDEALELFENGVKAAKICNKQLSEAKQKITELNEADFGFDSADGEKNVL